MMKFFSIIFSSVLSYICLFLGISLSFADSTSPHLAAYYDRKMLICGQTAYQWHEDNQPNPVANDVVQVGVGRNSSYVLTTTGQLLTWGNDPQNMTNVIDQVVWFTSGRTGVFASLTDGTFVYIERPKNLFGEESLSLPQKISVSVAAASIGDSADYFVKSDGTLFVKGQAHRGQYGDGRLKPTDQFIAVANEIIAVKAHTGHAILLKKDGTVMGTGGNIYGPLGRHGIGDKAVHWGPIFRDAVAIATGSSHSLAIRQDGTLWHWGRDIGLDPGQAMENVVAAAADQSVSVALLADGSLWQWQRDQKPKQLFQCP